MAEPDPSPDRSPAAYRCPECSRPLRQDDATFHCEDCSTVVGRQREPFDDFMETARLDPDLKDFYENEGTRGDEKGGPRLSARRFKVPHVLDVLPENHRPDSWLDLGCGGGWVMEALRTHWPDTKRVGLDISSTRLREASRRNPGDRFVRSPATKTPFPDEDFELVTLLDLIEHVPEPRTLLQEARRVARTMVIKFPLEDTLFDRAQKDLWWPAKRRVKALLRGREYDSPFRAHLHRFNRQQAKTLVESQGFVVLNTVKSESPWEDNHTTMYPPAYNITASTPLHRRIDFYVKRFLLVGAMRLTNLVLPFWYDRIFNTGVYLYCRRQ